jgi:AbrB family looped-hinge helix DNA binding protein
MPEQWYCSGMRATIDKVGRLVIPKQLREELGIRPGEVEVTAQGAGLRVELLVEEESLEERSGRLVIPAGGTQIDDLLVRQLRDAGQK